MPSELPRLSRVSSRRSTRHSRTPDVQDVMRLRATLNSDLSVERATVVSWPSPTQAVLRSPTIPRNDIRQAHLEQLDQMNPLLHVRVMRKLEEGLKALKLAYPNVDVPAVQQGPIPDAAEIPGDDAVSALDRSADVYHQPFHGNKRQQQGPLASHDDPPPPPSSIDLFARYRAVVATTTSSSNHGRPRDAFSDEEDAAVLRLDLVARVLSDFARVFKTHQGFLGSVAAEALFFAKTIHDIAQRRVAAATERCTSCQDELRALRERDAALQAEMASLRRDIDRIQMEKNQLSERDGSCLRRLNVVEAMLDEVKSELAERESVVAIQARRLLDADKRIEALEGEVATAAANTIALHKQLAGRQQLIDKLKSTTEQLYQERASLQRQMVQIAKRSAAAAGGGGRRSVTVDKGQGPTTTGSTAQLVGGLEAILTAQMTYLEDVLNLSVSSLSESFSKGWLTPRPTANQMSIDGNALLTTTAGRFLDMRQRIQRLTAELVDAKDELREAIALHGSVVHDRTARFTVPGIVQALGPAYLPPPHHIIGHGPKWFLSLGDDDDDPSVPEHLRAPMGKVRNLRLGRDMVVKYSMSFLRWLYARLKESTPHTVGASRTFYSARFTEWIFEHFAASDAITMSYSLHEGLRCFAYESLCGYLYELLAGGVSVSVWITLEDDWLARIHDLFLRAARDSDAQLSKKQAFAILERALYILPDDDIARVMAALSKDHVGDGINVTSVLVDGNDKYLARALREVLLRDRLSLIAEVETALMDDPSTSGSTVSPHAVVTSMLKIDPNRPSHQIEATLLHVFGSAMQQSLDVADPQTPFQERFIFCGETVPLATALSRLRETIFGRWTKQRSVAPL